MSEPVRLIVTGDEREHEEWLTQLRRSESRRRGITQKGRARRLGSDDWTPERTGARGEMAWSAYNRMPPPVSVNIGHRLPDWPPDWEIRCRARHSWQLIIRPDDPPGRRYVHITTEGTQALLWGYIWHREVRPEWLADHGGHGRAYFVPHTALHPMPMPEWWVMLHA